MVAFNKTLRRPVASKVVKAETLLDRGRGLLGRGAMEPGEGLWIAPCRSIHTFFMRFPIDAVFLSPELRAVRVLEGLKPWRLSPWVWQAGSVLELPGASLKGSVRLGDELEII